MIRNKAQILDYLIKKLRSSCPDVEEAALVTDEGLVLVCTSDSGEQKDRFSALAAAAMRHASRSAENLDLGETSFVIVAGQNGNLYMKWIDGRSFLAATVRRNADWRAVRQIVGRTATDIRHIGEIRGNLASTTQLA
jgi:predicted regulator of Ras-like GTPase activity (Roadblock/LC7/MglB family)